MKGQAFCRDHLQTCPSVSPLSGSEPDFDPDLWNSRQDFRETHNCFSYAMNVYDPKQVAACHSTPNCEVPFPQPGIASGHDNFSESLPKTCPNMLLRIFGDNPIVRMSDFNSQCPAGFSKIALIIDESDDYHFLRQDANGYWSHKPGARHVTNVDACGHLIWNPKLANYNYASNSDSSLNYDIFCSFMCVPRNRPIYMRRPGRRHILYKMFQKYL